MLVAEHLSFRRAATMLGVRQSAVSRRIRSLEDVLGVSLFERTYSGVRITVLLQFDYAIKTAGAAGRGEIGHLRIGVSSSIAAGFLRNLLRTFCMRHPNVRLQFCEVTSREQLGLIRKGRLDAAFVMDTPLVANCEVAQFWTERLFVALPREHNLCIKEEVEWEALGDERFVQRQSDPSSATENRIIKRLTDLGYCPDVQKFDVGRETCLHLVGLGLGVSVTSEATITNFFPEVEFRPIASPSEVVPCSGVWSPKNDNPTLRRLLSLARTLTKSGQRERIAS